MIFTRSNLLPFTLSSGLLLLAGCGDDGEATDGNGTDTEAMDSGNDDGDGSGDTGGADGSDGADDGSGDADTGGGEVEVPDVYEFESRFEPGVSSVAYSGQSFRQTLVASLKREMAVIQSEIADDNAVFAEGEVAARLLFYYDFDPETSGEVPHLISTMPATLQTTFAEISEGGADLVSKTAGNDAEKQHKDWSSALMGWPASDNPEDLVRDWIAAADALAVAYSTEIPTDPNGVQISAWYISPEGLDYQQLLEKFLLGAVNYSQGTDDYLDEGLMADNTMSDDGDPYTALEHQWDEGFGYWGGARNYLDYTDEKIASAESYEDYDGDGAIDIKSEINFSASTNAGKRDKGAAELGVETDYTTQTMTAFLTGRAIITAAGGALSAERMAALEEQRDIAVDGWERAVAATAVHYFNDTIQDMLAADYSFADHAKHWGELKGFLLTLQFNPRSQVSEEDLQTIHELVGTAPVIPGTEGDAAYIEDLLTARGLLADSYGFDAALVGDDNGENGW